MSDQIKAELREQADELKKKGINPCLAVVLVGNDSASQVYVRNKERACQVVGIQSMVYRMPEETTQAQLMELVAALNEDKHVHGILVQVPLPRT